MVIGAWWFALMGLFVKLAGRHLPSLEIVLFRAILTLALSYWAVRAAGVPSIWGQQKRLLLVRGLLGAIGINCFYFSLVHLPLGEATLIQYTNPIFATLLAGLWVGERVRRVNSPASSRRSWACSSSRVPASSSAPRPDSSIRRT